MGCFLGCFGLSSKRKRRKPANRLQPGDHDHRIVSYYQPLDSATRNLDVKEEPIKTDSEPSKRSKETLNNKIRKKVSFNLNVQTYEPIPKEYEEEEESKDLYWENDYDDRKEEISKGTKKECESKKDSTAEKTCSYSSNYRYKNCIESYDEEDDIACNEESDLDELDDNDLDEDDFDFDSVRVSQDEFCKRFNSLNMSSEVRDSLSEEKSENFRAVSDSKSVHVNRNGRNRSQYVHSVLNPIENLSQWKAVKAKEISQVKIQRIENQGMKKKPEIKQEIAVDASLSNWVVSADSWQSKNSSSTESISSKKSPVGNFPWRSRVDMPILDITNI